MKEHKKIILTAMAVLAIVSYVVPFGNILPVSGQNNAENDAENTATFSNSYENLVDQINEQSIEDIEDNIARAEGVRQANVLQAQGEAQAITTIDEQLRQSPSYLEWLKSQKWDGQLPLVVGGGAGSGGSGSGVTPFIEIPTSRDELQSTSGSGGVNTNSSSSGLWGAGETLQSVLNDTLLSGT